MKTVHSLILKSIKKFGLNSVTHSKVIALLIFTKFTCYLMEVCHLVIIVDEKQVKKWYNEFQNFYTYNFSL
jgi:hypothetical protein